MTVWKILYLNKINDVLILIDTIPKGRKFFGFGKTT